MTAWTGSKEQQARAHNAHNTHNTEEKRLCRLELPCVHKREIDDTHTAKTKEPIQSRCCAVQCNSLFHLSPTRKGTMCHACHVPSLRVGPCFVGRPVRGGGGGCVLMLLLRVFLYHH